MMDKRQFGASWAGLVAAFITTISGNAQTVVRVLEPAVLIVDQLKIDLDEDGLNDFEFRHLVHEDNGNLAISTRIVGFTHIAYPGEVGENPILLHSNFHGHFEILSRLPGAPGRMLVIDSDEIIFGEVARLELSPTGGFTYRSYWNPRYRTYLGLGVETLDGIVWGWAEISVVSNQLYLTAFGYEASPGDLSLIGGIPRPNHHGLRFGPGENSPALMWPALQSSLQRVEESVNLIDWELVDSLPAEDGEGGMSLSIPATPTGGRRYYRLIYGRD